MNDKEKNRMTDFYNQLQLSKNSMRNYKNALNSSFMKEQLLKECGETSLFCIVDLDVLWNFYSKINLHPKNIENHRAYSAATMKYIRFLNDGKKYGHRIDFKKPRGKKE